MKEVYGAIKDQITRIQKRSGKDGHTQPPMSGIDQVLVETAIPVKIRNKKGAKALTDEESEELLKFSKEVGNEISSRIDTQL